MRHEEPSGKRAAPARFRTGACIVSHCRRGSVGGCCRAHHHAQQETVVIGLQQARALAAARAGIDWAAYNALNGSCAGGTLSLSAASLAGYTVIVTCAATAYTNGNGSFQAYSITAAATFGSYGSADFARRVMRATFTNET